MKFIFNNIQKKEYKIKEKEIIIKKGIDNILDVVLNFLFLFCYRPDTDFIMIEYFVRVKIKKILFD